MQLSPRSSFGVYRKSSTTSSARRLGGSMSRPFVIAPLTWWEGDDCYDVYAWESEEAFKQLRRDAAWSGHGTGRRERPTGGYF